MLAWINNSQLNGYWGNETSWWKVRSMKQQQEKEQQQQQQQQQQLQDPTSFYDSLNPAADKSDSNPDP